MQTDTELSSIELLLLFWKVNGVGAASLKNLLSARMLACILANNIELKHIELCMYSTSAPD